MKHKNILVSIVLVLIVGYVGYYTKFNHNHNFENLVADSLNSVVYIEVKSPIKKENIIDRFKLDPPNNQSPIATGTGFFISSNLIVTNSHVVGNGIVEDIKIYTEPSTTFLKAEIVGVDNLSDIAVLRIDDKLNKSTNVPVLWGDSHSMKQGESVYAIGHPFGLTFSVTKGIVSYNNRYMNNPYQEVIQTDTTINQGNSGGPLFNMDGKVIGINTFIFNKNNSGSIGLNFAVTEYTAQFIIDRLIKEGEVKRAYMGLKLRQDQLKRVSIESIEENGPASKSELLPGDRLISFNNLIIADLQQFFDIVERQFSPDQEINIIVHRFNDIDIEPMVVYVKFKFGIKPKPLIIES